MRTFRLVAAVTLLAGSVARAQNPAVVEHRLRYGVRLADQPDIALDLIERMRSYHVPGLSIAIIDNHKVVYAKGFGVTEFGGKKAVDSTTLFLAGSISKPVFSTGFLRYLEERRIPLDTPANALLKSWRLPDSKFTQDRPVTLRHLLTHTAGLTVWGFPGYALDKPVPTVPQLLDGLPPSNTPAVRNDTFPGARWLYSGGGMTIAQLVATDQSGESFPALMSRLVLKPSGMTRSTYENPLPVARRREAASGHEELDTPVPGGFHVYPEMAAAGLWTNASDLARWAIALSRSYRGEKGGVLSPTMAKQMVSKQVKQQPPYGNGFWGLGVTVSGDGDSVTFSHGGRDEGFVADLVMTPSSGRGIVIMMNGVGAGLLAEIRRAFAEEYGTPSPPRAVRTAVTHPAAKMAQYAGSYVGITGRDTLRLDITVAPDGKSLAVYNQTTRRTIPLVPVGGEAFVGLEGGSAWDFEHAGDANSSVRAVGNGTGATRRVFTRQ